MNFTIVDENGKKVFCDVIGVFQHNNKNFIVYTDNELDNGSKEVYASLYKLKENRVVLLPITLESDWDLVDEYLANL